ncbi:MAG: pyridoxamine 5'-phosphate oxidase family protein [Bacteroidetes bacterium]|nr:pyridoxamine 5'-phosphate oxidase family protein [Bacteroidota bacterium]
MRHRFLTDRSEMGAIIRKCQVCHIAMVDTEGLPYLLPFNFGFDDGVIYLHSSRMGKKIAILENNPNVCIEFSTDYLLRFHDQEVGCSYTMKYRSVLAYGRVEFTEDPEEKIRIMKLIMQNYTSGDFTFSPPSIKEVCCFTVKPERMEGKINGY